jgi:hypothetical protein
VWRSQRTTRRAHDEFVSMAMLRAEQTREQIDDIRDALASDPPACM